MSTNDTERAGMVARWRKILAQRLRPAGPIAENHAAELAEFHERLEQLRDLAEATSDPMRASNYTQLWRTMGEELGFIASDLDRGQMSTADLPDKLQEWSDLGLTYLHTKQDYSAVEKILAPDDDEASPDARGSSNTADTASDDELDPVTYAAPLSRGAVPLYMGDGSEFPDAPALGQAHLLSDMWNGNVWIWPGKYADTFHRVVQHPRRPGLTWDVIAADLVNLVTDSISCEYDAVHPLRLPAGSKHLSTDDLTRVQVQSFVDELRASGYDELWEQVELRDHYTLLGHDDQPAGPSVEFPGADTDTDAAAAAPGDGSGIQLRLKTMSPQTPQDDERTMLRLATNDLHHAPNLADHADGDGADAVTEYDTDEGAEPVEMLGAGDEQDPFGVAPVQQRLWAMQGDAYNAGNVERFEDIDVTLDMIRIRVDEYLEDVARADRDDDPQELLPTRRAELNRALNVYSSHLSLEIPGSTDREATALDAEAGVGMSRAEAAELAEPWCAGDHDELGDELNEGRATGQTSGQDGASSPPEDEAPQKLRRGAGEDQARRPELSEDVSAAIETSACAAAVSRAAVSVDVAKHKIDETTSDRAAELDREEQLSAWADADRLAHDTAQDQAMKNDTATVSDDSPSW